MRLQERDQEEDAVLTLGGDGATVIVVRRGLLTRRALTAMGLALALVDEPVEVVPYPEKFGVGHAVEEFPDLSP